MVMALNNPLPLERRGRGLFTHIDVCSACWSGVAPRFAEAAEWRAKALVAVEKTA